MVDAFDVVEWYYAHLAQNAGQPLTVDVWIFGMPEFHLEDNYWIPEGSLALQLQYAYLTMEYFKEHYPQKTCELRVLQVCTRSRT